AVPGTAPRAKWECHRWPGTHPRPRRRTPRVHAAAAWATLPDRHCGGRGPPSPWWARHRRRRSRTTATSARNSSCPGSCAPRAAARPGDFGSVSLCGREVGEDLRPVDTLPVKGMVREGVGVVPGDFLGEEPVEAGPACQLWQRPGVTETVRQPYAVGLDPELVDEVPLALGELTHDRLTG